MLEIFFIIHRTYVLPNLSFGWTFYKLDWTLLLIDNIFKKITQDVLVTYSVVVSDHNVKLAGHFQNLVEQCLVTDCYFQHCNGIIKLNI